MAFVSRYSNDVFISYAHVDDLAPATSARGWVTTFVDELWKELSRKLGRPDAAKVWKDDGMALHKGVTEQLMNAVRDTATFVLVLSPGYLASVWCAREKDAFLRQIRGEPRARSRLFVVELDNLDPGDRPEEIRDLGGYRFWAREGRDEPPRTLGQAGLFESNPDYNEYFKRLNRLVWELQKELRALKMEVEQGQRPVSARPPVLLAETTDDLEKEREGVVEYLDQCGVPTRPEGPYPREEPEAFESALQADLSACTLFIQLLSGVRGKRVPGSTYGYPRLQFEVAKRAGKDILQWMPPRLAVDIVDDPDHQLLLREQTVRAEGLEDFKREIKRRVFANAQPERGRTSAERPISAFVFVDCEKDDVEMARGLKRTLDRLGVPVFLPIWQGNAQTVRQDLEGTLKDCHALIVVYGTTTVDWVRSQFRLYYKVLAERTYPARALAVYLGPPKKEMEELNIGMPNLRQIDCTSERSDLPALLREFVGELRA